MIKFNLFRKIKREFTASDINITSNQSLSNSILHRKSNTRFPQVIPVTDSSDSKGNTTTEDDNPVIRRGTGTVSKLTLSKKSGGSTNSKKKTTSTKNSEGYTTATTPSNAANTSKYVTAKFITSPYSCIITLLILPFFILSQWDDEQSDTPITARRYNTRR